jgi:carbamoyltransferase
MRILGLHDGTHDAGAALVEHGRVVAACNEERFTRRKGQGGWPTASIAACLAYATGPVDRVAFAGVVNPNPALRLARGVQARVALDGDAFWSDSDGPRARALSWLQFDSPFPHVTSDTALSGPLRGWMTAALRRAARASGVDAPVDLHDHHRCHAAAAWAGAGAPHAAVLVADGVGDGLATSAWEGHGPTLTRRWALPYPHSHGLFYASVTGFLGFRPFRHEGKLVGLAAHGDPDAIPLAWPFRDTPDGLRFDLRFGAPLRAWLEPLRNARREDVCAWLQRGLEQDLLALARRARADTDAPVLALAGGVFANVRLNQRLAEDAGFARIHVFPHMGDGGLAVGAAILSATPDDAEGRGVAGRGIPSPPQDPLPAPLALGPDPADTAETLVQLRREGFHVEHRPDTALAVAELLARGQVVARCAGRMEFGPRALGNRSILAPANVPGVTTRLNAALRRDDFMPFAPLLREEDATDWIVLPDASRDGARTMTITAHAREALRTLAPAAVHVDGTLRPQLVAAARTPWLDDLLVAYRARTGLPALLNTSLNVHEEPIVARASEAAATFRAARLDALVLDDALVTR